MKLSKIVNSFEKLVHAQSYSFRELKNEIAAIKLDFETFNCFVEVVEESDEIRLARHSRLGQLVATDKPLGFHSCYGSRLCWGWIMTNNQGYSDGLRFEFENNQIIELIVVASSIKQFSVSEL